MKKQYLKYILALLLFGSNGIVASKIALQSYEIVYLRTFAGSMLLLLYLCLSGRGFTFYRHRRDFLYIMLSGFAMGAGWIFLYEAYSRIGVGKASLLYYCGPVIVMALSGIVFGEKTGRRTFFGFCAVFCGVILLNIGTSSHKNDVWGIIFGFASAAMYSLMVILGKKAKNIKGLENSALELFFSFIISAVFAAFKGPLFISIPQSSVFPLIFLGFINTGLGCLLYFSSISALPVKTVAVCGYIEPLSAVLMSCIFLHETLTPFQTAGAFLIVGGALFAELKKK